LQCGRVTTGHEEHLCLLQNVSYLRSKFEVTKPWRGTPNSSARIPYAPRPTKKTLCLGKVAGRSIKITLRQDGLKEYWPLMPNYSRWAHALIQRNAPSRSLEEKLLISPLIANAAIFNPHSTHFGRPITPIFSKSFLCLTPK
jgi:hypothetical protein